jgi:hypothetical protein
LATSCDQSDFPNKNLVPVPIWCFRIPSHANQFGSKTGSNSDPIRLHRLSVVRPSQFAGLILPLWLNSTISSVSFRAGDPPSPWEARW